VQKDIVALIQQLVTEDAMSLLFISHDIALASEIADRIAVFRNGRSVEVAPTDTLLASPAQVYTRMLLDAHLGLEETAG
jgi:peptide/nickel transport system ATP-binding protein